MADYRLTPTGQYVPDVRLTDDPEEERLLEKPIGKWGQMWQDWIQATYPAEVVVYTMAAKWWIIPRQIDEKAEKRYDELDEIFGYNNPRPDTDEFVVLRQWEEERKLWVESILMEEIIHVRYPAEI